MMNGMNRISSICVKILQKKTKKKGKRQMKQMLKTFDN